MVEKLINKRRSYRSLKKSRVDKDDIIDIVKTASLAPSCFNNQPWRVIACLSEESLEKIKEVYSKGNEWCYNASCVLIVWSKKEFDCIIKENVYYLFDTGIFVGYLTLLFTERGLVAHPIAGFSPTKVKSLFGLDNDSEVITLIIIGKHEEDIDKSLLTDDQKSREVNRPARKEVDEILKFC